jgi:hypothetical protein
MKTQYDILALVRLYYERKKASKDAKWALQKSMIMTGRCDGHIQGWGPCYSRHRLPLEDWCDVCKTNQPLWVAYHKASRMVAVATTALLRAGKELSRKNAP